MERSWTNPLNSPQEAICYSFIKFCIYSFYVLRILCALGLESRKKLLTWSSCSTFGISVSRGHRHNVLGRCNSIFPLLKCQWLWNKTCTQLSLSQILFQNPKNYSLEDVQRNCYHSWCYSTVIVDQINNSSNVYLSSSRFWTATISSYSTSSLPSRNREYQFKTFHRFGASFP